MIEPNSILTVQDVMSRLHISRYMADNLMKRIGRFNIGNGEERPRWAVSEAAFERFVTASGRKRGG